MEAIIAPKNTQTAIVADEANKIASWQAGAPCCSLMFQPLV